MGSIRQFVLLLILLGLVIYFRNDLVNAKDKIVSFFQETNQGQTTDSVLASLQKEILTPPPLRLTTSTSTSAGTTLTDAGVIELTNENRTENGSAVLTENAKLDAAAKLKLDDMFANQYFEHVSPSGKGPADLANEVSYQYVLIGENLAEGNFVNNSDLLTAWMNSPGHRANILNPRFKEIGVAVGKGEFEGHETWMAVQEFGEPLSDCPAVSSTLDQQITTLQQTVSSLDTDLKAKKQDLDATSQSDPSYNQKAAAYNAEVDTYNADLAQVKQLISQYNAEVQAFNQCVAS